MTNELAGAISDQPGLRSTEKSALPRVGNRRGILGAESGSESRSHTVALLSLTLSLEDRELLRQVATEPCLTAAEIAEILGWVRERVVARRNRLIRLGLLRLLASEEVGEQAKLRLVEATVDGLKLVAADAGLSLSQAVFHLGLVGGGPSRPIGSRSALLRRFEHTRGVATVLVDLYRSARVLRERGEDDDVVEWRNAAACARRHVRPDGYVIYRHRGQLYGAFVEFDRGTMRARDYHRKSLAYAEYLRSEKYARDYDGFPTILFLTPNALVEERVASAARQLAAERRVHLPILLTHLWHPGSEPDGANGLLGPVWRMVDGEVEGRRHWPLRVQGLSGSDLTPRGQVAETTARIPRRLAGVLANTNTLDEEERLP